MNNVDNKIKLWNACSQMGLFNNVNPAFENQIKQLFEETISKFNTNNNTDINVLNNFFMEEFKRSLGKLLGTNGDTMNALEKKQQEYRDMFKPQVPEPIDFTKGNDKPLEGNMEDILREKEEERKMEMNRILGQQPTPITNVNLNVNSNDSNSSNFSFTPSTSGTNSVNSINAANNMFSSFQNQQLNHSSNQSNHLEYSNSQILKILEKQSIILMKLLESQVKIIELLQKK